MSGQGAGKTAGQHPDEIGSELKITNQSTHGSRGNSLAEL